MKGFVATSYKFKYFVKKTVEMSAHNFHMLIRNSISQCLFGISCALDFFVVCLPFDGTYTQQFTQSRSNKIVLFLFLRYHQKRKTLVLFYRQQCVKTAHGAM